jgi:hypothetical protein
VLLPISRLNRTQVSIKPRGLIKLYYSDGFETDM